ncbi:enoyl-CoA hydratase-related protein [Rhodococcus sp. DMU1]|uniref:enoyl-CoA hydratase-related protein n=1 Tax=Rhodococcus sp. DMU1 TaxID=2722825 RepID=UPI00143E7062|nr:enoyl-CoA hydratase-related protein [Rhodococcus sp. DMU1]QIX52669.1 enoyl-CoA hydratase [Rhodococcus sp. DMU1]
MANTATDELVRTQHGPVLILRLNRPDARNALTGSLLNAIGSAVNEAEADPDTRVVVLTATGDRAFCAGMDLRAFADGDSIGLDSEDGLGYQRLCEGTLSIPVVGAVNGSAVGGGLELLLGCDVVVSSSAAKFALPEVSRGLFPAGGGTSLGTRIPLGAALELTLTGDAITAERARELGLVNAVVDPEQVLESALRYAERIAANAPLGLAACKELVRLAVTAPDRVADRLGHWQSTVFGSADAREGAVAFVEKRAPVWQGR